MTMVPSMDAQTAITEINSHMDDLWYDIMEQQKNIRRIQEELNITKKTYEEECGEGKEVANFVRNGNILLDKFWENLEEEHLKICGFQLDLTDMKAQLDGEDK